MIVNTLWQSIRSNKNLWFVSIVVAILCTFSSQRTAVANLLEIAASSSRVSVPPTANGIYLYGESDRPNVVGKEYMVFETIGTKTIGAFYLPNSEFSCFYGKFRGSRMYVTLIDAYDLQKYKLTLALNANGLTASKQPMMGEPSYQPLGTVSDNDLQILNTCKQQLQKS
ncbi:hypothetical protein [Chamaesiphon minutus]|uniref:Uncharacterized protein n=1 Tax=Chamaesiphon minutus (strain ATCC 27169 / PCC 6605) TaxID=1173020 RepID=K9UEV6_CHAP6|nr:hypothetical protein [Chamaesiphon minutus]AFY93340.1 hypothetical protein Cha6605_2260 [Chamaesiphon minutus PCC 6605]